MQSELSYLLSSKTESKVDCIAGPSVPSCKCCLEPRWKLIGIIWFVWHSYCVEESKNKLRHLYTGQVWSTRTCKLMPKETRPGLRNSMMLLNIRPLLTECFKVDGINGSWLIIPLSCSRSLSIFGKKIRCIFVLRGIEELGAINIFLSPIDTLKTQAKRFFWEQIAWYMIELKLLHFINLHQCKIHWFTLPSVFFSLHFFVFLFSQMSLRTCIMRFSLSSLWEYSTYQWRLSQIYVWKMERMQNTSAPFSFSRPVAFTGHAN